jgi:hypothetical protein
LLISACGLIFWLQGSGIGRKCRCRKEEEQEAAKPASVSISHRVLGAWFDLIPINS